MPCCRESGFWSFHFPMQWGLGASALPSAIEWTCISLHWDINNMGLSFVLVRLRCSSHCLDMHQCPFRGVAAIVWTYLSVNLEVWLPLSGMVPVEQCQGLIDNQGQIWTKLGKYIALLCCNEERVSLIDGLWMIWMEHFIWIKPNTSIHQTLFSNKLKCTQCINNVVIHKFYGSIHIASMQKMRHSKMDEAAFNFNNFIFSISWNEKNYS